jgi:hypothetical protein
VQTWLSDGSEAIVTAPAGLTLRDAVVDLVPRAVGSFTLWARVFDANGCSFQTGVVRRVMVDQ